MNSTHLNEHDANQGAQSSCEFLGMTGNSGWFLLGSGGATILMVILLWGILGISLLLCLFVGIVLCLFSVVYVFTLKNNKPEHYDTDFFESALVEAGVLPFSFGPRARRPLNPYSYVGMDALLPPAKESRTVRQASSTKRGQSSSRGPSPVAAEPIRDGPQAKSKATRTDAEPMVTRVVFERLQERLTTTEEMLEDAIAERGED